MAFTLTDTTLRRICEINSFPVATNGMVFVGFRGCLLTNPDDQESRTEQGLEVVAGSQEMSPRLRFGSRGLLVSEVQPALKGLGFYEGQVDLDLGSHNSRGPRFPDVGIRVGIG